MNIVLVHGFISTGKIFFYIKKRLESFGHKCFAPTLKPIDARYGIEDLAIKLKDFIENNIGTNSKFVLVGFSLGGIVCRYYLQEMGGINSVTKLFTVSTPHHGSFMSYLYPGKGIKQLRPNSLFLKSLQKNEHLLSGLKIYSYRTPFDLMIIPNKSSVWDVAVNKRFVSIMHFSMLINRNLVREIIKEL